MARIRMEDGDLRWVFPQLGEGHGDGAGAGAAETEAVRAALAAADAGLRRSAERLGAEGGGGLTYYGEAGIVDGTLQGSVEADGVLLLASVGLPRRCLWDLRWGPPWQVSVALEVWCDAPDGCRGHVLADRDRSYDTPLAAAGGLAEAVGWLEERAAARTPAGWREAAGRCDG